MSEARLTAVGDVMLGRKVADKIRENGHGFQFNRIRHLLDRSDINFCVLDAPVSNNGEPNPGKPPGFPLIKCGPESLNVLKHAGFDITHIGTNHILDFGKKGLAQTVRGLESIGIKHIGAEENMQKARCPVVIEKNNISFAFLGYCLSYPADRESPGCAPLKLKFVREDIKSVIERVDHVIVSIHHGIEYSHYPYPEYREMAHHIIDCGARAVLGHHPHVIQGYETYKNCFIIYSMGNAVFDKDEDRNEKDKVSRLRLSLEKEGVIAVPNSKAFYEGIMARLVFDKKGITSSDFVPIVINEGFQPECADEERAGDILAFLESISKNLSGLSETGKRLSRLYAEEDMVSFVNRDIWSLVNRIHKIRFRHVRQAWLSLLSKVS